MKITKIHIKDFHQFKDFTIDLTYPKGHKKEGQPLDKICFIGQSGTGKTTLLELIPKFLYNYDTNLFFRIDSDSIYDEVDVDLTYGNKSEYNVQIYFHKYDNKESDWNWSADEKTKKIGDWIEFFDNKWLNKQASKLIYFPSNLNYDLNFDSESTFNKKDIIDFSTDKVAVVWNLILEKIQSYQEKELQLRQEISKAVEVSLDENLDAVKKAVDTLSEWRKKEFNPVTDIADNCLDNLLKFFKLKVKTELDIKIKEDIGFIKIEDYNKNEIPNGLWSTGTKQVILSALPLYLLKPKKTIVLFDEPERSLYPDLQRIIVDYYSSLVNDCQFFYSTHSPIIASNFEPWEIVELKFNKEGKIYQELYYEGENHVDNYKFNPKHMRWDDILQRVFDLENDGSKDREDKLNELAVLNVKFKKLKTENKHQSVAAKKILEHIEILSKELSKWN